MDSNLNKWTQKPVVLYQKFRDIAKKFETTIDRVIPIPVTFLTLLDNVFQFFCMTSI